MSRERVYSLPETHGQLARFYKDGILPPSGAQPVPQRDDIEILFKPSESASSFLGFPCSSVSFSRSLGLQPDRGSITIAKSDLGLIVIRPPDTDVDAAARLALGIVQTALGEAEEPREVAELVGIVGQPPQGLEIAGSLRMYAPHGQIILGPIYLDKTGIRETQVSEDREGKPAPFGSPVGAGAVPPKSVESIVTVSIADERIWWERRGVVSGRYNIESNIRGVSVMVGPQRFETKTLKGLSLFSLADLLQICVANLPPREFTYKGEKIDAPVARKIVYYHPTLDTEFPLNVEWKGILAANALRKLLSDYKLHLNLRYDGDVDIFFEDWPGQYDPQEKLADLLGDIKEGSVYSFKPPSAIVVGRPKIREQTIRYWIPVTVSDGTISGYPEGAIVPLSTAIYRWGYTNEKLRKSLLTWFDGKDSKAFADLSGTNKEKRKKILKETAYQWFQAVYWRDYVPILEKRVKLVGGEIQEAPCEVKASWFEPKKKKDPLQGGWRNMFYRDAKDYLSEVDNELLILKFKQPMGCIAVTRAKDADVLSAAKTTQQNLNIALANWMALVLGQAPVGTALHRVRAQSEALLEDFSITNLHVCDFYAPAIEYKFMFVQNDNFEATINGEIADELLSGRDVAPNPLDGIFQSDRFIYYIGEGIPEVIESDIQVYYAEEWNNEQACLDEALQLVYKRFSVKSVREMKDVVIAGFQVIPNSGKVTQVAWESDGEMASTKVKYGDFIRGIDFRAGIDWREKRPIVVETRARVD